MCDGSNDCSDGDDEHNCRKFMIALRTPREFSFNSCGHFGLKSDFFFRYVSIRQSLGLASGDETLFRTIYIRMTQIKDLLFR